MERRAPLDPSSRPVVVYGAYGHTGRFVTAELLRRGLVPILSGRDSDALAAMGAQYPDLAVRPAAVDDVDALRRALHGAAAVVNCAGPFLDTALPVVAEAVRAGAHYLDVSAEQAAVQAVHRHHGARTAGVAVVPAMAFYGGLADLLATAAMADWTTADEITVAVALDRWWPTAGTRHTGRRNTAQRLVVENGVLAPTPDPPRTRTWQFAEPFGEQDVIGTQFSEIITMTTHLRASRIHSFLNRAPLRDLHDPATSGPAAVDASGRSAQRFAVDVVVRNGECERRITAAGRDIYAVTAPIAVEAVQRLLDGRSTTVGVAAPGAAFDADALLGALSPEPLTITRSTRCTDHPAVRA